MSVSRETSSGVAVATDGHPRVTSPARIDRRGGRYLLVWDSPAQWLVADRELLELIRLLDGSRSAEAAVGMVAAGNGTPAADLGRAAAAALSELERRGLLAEERPVEDEAVSLANITYNLTNRCNLRCRWCYNSGRHTREVPVETVMAALAGARHLFAADATLSLLGGEPTIDPERLERCLALAEELFDRPVLLSTNGTLIDPRLARMLAGRRVEVQVSLDGPDSASNDEVRGAGTFHRALDGITTLTAAGVPVILSMVFDCDGPALFEAYLELGRRLGAAKVRFIPLRLIGRGQPLRERMPDLLSAWGELRRVTARQPELAALLKRDFFSILSRVCGEPGCKTGCGLGRQVLFIDADGAVYPCPSLTGEEYYCGNVAADSVAGLVLESPVFQRLRGVCHVSRRSGCRSCEYRHWCAGDCRAEALSCGEDLRSPAPHCAELRRLIPELLWNHAAG